MSATAIDPGTARRDPFAHVTAAGWGRGLNALIRITRMTLRHPWQAGLAIGTTFAAAALQLMIPRLLGRAVDQTQAVLTGGDAAQAARDALWSTALLLLVVSVLARPLHACCRTTSASSVGHHIGYELRLAFYEKIQRLSFAFHDRVHSGDLITIGMLDLEGVRMFFSTGIVRMVLLTILIGIGSYLLLSTDLRPRPARAQLRPLRRLALLGHPPAAARHLARPAGAPVGADPGDGGEPRRHPRGPRLRRPGARDDEVRRRLEERARARPPARRHPRRQHQRDVLLLLRRDGPGALGRRPARSPPARSASAR